MMSIIIFFGHNNLLKYKYFNTALGSRSVKYPDDFKLHQHLKKHQEEARIKKLSSGSAIDWGLAEALAIGSLLYQGKNTSFLKSIFIHIFILKKKIIKMTILFWE